MAAFVPRGFYAVLDRDDETLARLLVGPGGSRVLQIRITPGCAADVISAARRARCICDTVGAALIINDRVDVALAVAADGVHLGQTDLPLAAARKLAGRRLVIGISTHDVSQVELAVREGADYLGFGPIFQTSTKHNADPTQGLVGLHAAVTAARGTPIVAIGGITPGAASAVYSAGASAICAIAAVNGAADVVAAARAMGRDAS
jgi:thiamine-phosphate pyrophosphorylase